jgi:hypothetical protein
VQRDGPEKSHARGCGAGGMFDDVVHTTSA